MKFTVFLVFLYLGIATLVANVTIISNPGMNANSTSLSVNQAGDAIVAWQQADSTVWAATRPAGGSWAAPHQITVSNSSIPWVSLNDHGMAIVVWGQTAAGPIEFIQAATFSFNTGWSGTINVTSPTAPDGNRDHPVVAINNAGNAVVLWTFATPTPYYFIEGTTYNGTTFGSIITISDQMVDATTVSSVGLNADGSAAAIWPKQPIALPRVAYATSANSGALWSLYNLSSNGNSLPQPQIAVGGDQRAAVWCYAQNANEVVYGATSATTAAQLGTPLQISDNNETSAPKVALNVSDDKVAIWDESVGPDTLVYGSTQTASGSWSSPVAFSSTGLIASQNSVTINEDGFISALWTSSDGTNSYVLSSNTVMGGSWTPPIALSASSPSSYTHPLIGLGSNDLPVAVWIGNSGGFSVIEASVATAPAHTTAPPILFQGEVIQNETLIHSEIIHRLTWGPSSSGDVTHYLLSRNGILIATVSANALFSFNDRGRSATAIDSYSLVAVNTYGFESSPLTLSLP